MSKQQDALMAVELKKRFAQLELEVGLLLVNVPITGGGSPEFWTYIRKLARITLEHEAVEHEMDKLIERNTP